MANTPDLDPAKYIEELRAERMRLEHLGSEGVDIDVEASFGLSYARLPDDVKRVFRMASVLPADFDALAEEEVCGDEGHRQLSELQKWSLVDYLKGTGRYRLHDLVRVFAAIRLEKEDDEKTRFDVQQRHAEHYWGVLSAADIFYKKGGEDVLTGLNLFDREWMNIRAGREWAKSIALQANQSVASKMSIEKKLALRLCISYPDAGDYVLSLRLHPLDLIRWLKTALDAARQLKDRRGEGAVLGDLGIAYKNLGESHKSLEFHEHSLAIAREIKNRRAEGNALSSLGMAYKNLGEYQKALELLKQALAIAREVENRRGEGTALNRLGIAYKNLGEYQKALELHKQALAIAREIGDKRGEGAVLGNMGIAYYDLGEYRKAIKFQDQSLVIARGIRDRRREGNALWNMSLALDKIGMMVQAIDYARMALEIYKQIGSPYAKVVWQQLAEWQK